MRMKDRMRKVLFELLKDSKRSDRELAKVLGVSQPTVTRTRSRLVKEGVIKEFTVVPDFTKMGYELMAITSFRSNNSKELEEKAVKETMSRPNILFAANAMGARKNGVVISVHKNYSDYSRFIKDVRLEGGNDIEDWETLLIALEGFIPKPLSLKSLAKIEEKID